MSGSLFDFGLFAFHNAKELLARGSGPYFYLPKMESHLEARLWNDVFIKAEGELAIPAGSIKATVLIETILATFEMDEILWELQGPLSRTELRTVGLHLQLHQEICRGHERAAAGSRAGDDDDALHAKLFEAAYQDLPSSQGECDGWDERVYPDQDDPVANEKALTQVRADKEREATDGHDGTWVAHPGLVPVALEVFNRVMPQPNQIEKQLPDYHVTAEDLLQVPEGTISEAGVRQNVAVGLGYVEAWLRGIGCVPLFNLMEDAATAEISRAQLWQWVHHHAVMDDGLPVTVEMVDEVIADELERAKTNVGAERYGAYTKAADLMRSLVRAARFTEFLTVPAYDRVLAEGALIPLLLYGRPAWLSLHDEAFCCASGFEEFGEFDLDDMEA